MLTVSIASLSCSKSLNSEYMVMCNCFFFFGNLYHLKPEVEYDSSLVHYGEGNGTPLKYSCLENPMDGGAW